MKDIVTNLIKKLIIPKYGPLGYYVSLGSDGHRYERVSITFYTDEMDENAKGIIDDTKMILSMLGFSVSAENHSLHSQNFIIVSGGQKRI